MNMRVLAALLLLPAASLTLSGARAADPEWWSPEWLSTSNSPSFEVHDTVNKYGRYAGKTRPSRLATSSVQPFHRRWSKAGALKVAFDFTAASWIAGPPYRLEQLGPRRRCCPYDEARTRRSASWT
jgi:hypothetical protein